jgi:hypothetical protein
VRVGRMMADPREFLLPSQAADSRAPRLIPVEGRVLLTTARSRRGASARCVAASPELHVPDMRNLDYRPGPLHYLHSEAAASLTNCYTRRPTGYQKGLHSLLPSKDRTPPHASIEKFGTERPAETEFTSYII